MKYHTAPAAALKALEASARHLSFTRAAGELNVTQSAISHQIKHLEELWDAKLFERRKKGLELTPAGRALAAVVRDFFTRLEDTLETIHHTPDDTVLRVEALPSFAVKWLVPRLQRFREAHGDADVWLSTSMHETVSFDGSDADIAVHMSRGEYPGYDVEFIMNESIFPVCRPRFLETHGAPESPADLVNYPLLLRHHEILTPTWEYWFDTAGVPEDVYVKALSEETHFPDSNMALQAAFDGQGVALARGAHAWDDVGSGRLVRLFPDFECPFNLSYFAISPPGRAEKPLVKAFREWLVAEGRRFCEEYEGCGT
ncbi:MAG: transcriptional regulator GcvA [Rhodospirillaceae bacterium]|nr:transcriptional regulator GcvA [Rhodospirillaceae bacterium]